MKRILSCLLGFLIAFSSITPTYAGKIEIPPNLKWLLSYPEKVQQATFFDKNFNKKLASQMKEKSDSIFKNLSPIERDAIKNYTGRNNVSFFLTNPDFDYKHYPVDRPTLESYVSSISSLIAKNRLKKDVTLFQGNSLECLDKTLSESEIEKFKSTTNENDVEDILKELKGKVLSTNDFSSTSTSFNVACDFADKDGVSVILIIKAKKGLNYLPIMHHSVCPGEDEVLLARNLKFKINNAIFVAPSLHIVYNEKGCLFLECETVNE